MFKTAAIFLGLAGSAAAQDSVIAGYLARSDATDHLEIDLIQKELETLIGNEDCTNFTLAGPFYDGTSGSGLGDYFSTVPTYGLGGGEQLAVVSKEFTKYYDWEGDDESPADRFTDHWARRAIAQGKTKFARGNANFGSGTNGAFPKNVNPGKECIGFEESLKKSLSYTATLYESYQLAQKAIDLAVGGCSEQLTNCTDAVDAWDSAVAIYVGSLEGTDGNNDPDGSYGKAPYALADKRCRNFQNCGPTHDKFTKDIPSPINTQVLALWSAGSYAAYAGNYWLMYYYLRLISNISAVPLIQGTIRYAYKLSTGTDFSDKSLGELGAFAFGVLPKVWACSKKGEQKIFAQTKVGGGDAIAGVTAVNFEKVKLGFECNYKCLGITCKDVGALFDDDNATEPKPGAEACSDVDNGSENICDKPKGSVKKACKLFRGNPGIKGRDKLKFDQAEALKAFN